MIALKTVFLHFNVITQLFIKCLSPLSRTLTGSAEKDFHVYLVLKQAFPWSTNYINQEKITYNN